MERLPVPPLHPRNMVDSLFVVANCLSTSGDGAQALGAKLQAAEPDKKVFYVETAGTDEAANRELLWRKMDAGQDQGYTQPLILAAGGDGTAHYTGKALLHADAPDSARDALLTPWGLGYKNDLFASLHGRGMKGSARILQNPHGREVRSHVLDVQAIVGDNLIEDIALAYVTLGPSADGAVLLASEAQRKHRQRFPRFLRTAVDIIAAAPTVLRRPAIVHAKPEADRPGRPITEVSFNNSERMGGMGNYANSTGLGDHAMHYAELASNHPLALIRYTARIALGVPAGERVTGPVILRFEEEGLHGQIEGEPIRDRTGRIQPIKVIVVKPGDKTLRYYATKTPR